MIEPVLRWTPEESTLFAELARRALVATLDGGPPRRAGEGGFRAEPELAGDEVVIAVELDAAAGTLAVRPAAPSGHRWRDAWALELRGDGDDPRVLVAGAPPIAVAGRTALRVHLQAAPRALTRTLEPHDPPVPLVDAGFHRYTRQSTEQAAPATDLAPWASPTAPEPAPWWELDLGRTMYVASVRIDLLAPPPGARIALHAYGFAMPSGAPPPGSAVRDVVAEAGPTSIDAGGVVARYLRVTVTAAPGAHAVLTITAAEVLAAELFADTLAATFRRAFTLYADRPLFVARDDDGGYRPQLRYREVWARAMALARGLARRLEPALGDQRAFLAVMLRNRPEWAMADLAAVARGYVLVPIAPDDPDDRLASILARVRPACVICERDDVERVTRLAGDPLRLVVVCDADAAAPGRVGFDALIAEGEAAGAPPPAARAEDDLYTVLFTSGSTGTPRGAMRSYAAFLALVKSYPIAHSPHHLSFQPLSHLSERMYLPTLMIHGGTVGFSRGGVHLLDELRALAPTTVGSVPRLYEVLYARHQRRLRAALAAAPDQPRATIEAQVLADTRRAFGDRVLAVSVGSAPVGAEVYAFLRRCFADLWVSDGYGSTEVGTIAVDGKLLDSIAVQLRPVAGSTEPAAPGEPERGEIWVRSPHVIAGYLGEPDATAAAIDADGYFATGDLGERSPSGRVRLIGRVRNTVKLAQGEFVSAERIETALASAAIVDRVYVHVAPGAPAVAALIVPEPLALAGLLEVDPAPVAELARHPRATAVVLAAVRAHARAAGLAAYELPRGILLEPAPLTVDDGRLTASGKLARGALAARHGAALTALAAGTAAGDADAPAAAADDDLLARVVRAATRVLGRAALPHEPLGGGLGVDSLAAAEILATLGEDLGREVPLAWWFEARTLEDLAARLGRFGADRPAAATDAQVAADLALTPAVAPRASAPARPIRTVLLTGATGFLGAHLVEALRARGLRLVCLVRAPDDAAATARLAAALAAREIPVAPGDDLRAVAADLAAPALADTLAALPDTVDAIVHAGATVSWLASYPALRAANVLGTLALLELAAARGLRFHHVSTISTAPPDGDEDSVLALETVRAGTPYALSKWIAEQHVRRAAAAGLPVTIHRPAMIAAHTARGAGNPDDFLSRYLVGVIELGRYLDRDDAVIDMTPVDFVAAAIAALLVDAPATGATHHLANIAGSLTHAGLGRALVAAGLPLAPASYPDFRAALLRATASRLRPLAAFFPETFALAMGPWPCARTLATLAPLGVAPPRIDDAYLATWIAALRRHHHLPGSPP